MKSGNPWLTPVVYAGRCLALATARAPAGGEQLPAQPKPEEAAASEAAGSAPAAKGDVPDDLRRILNAAAANRGNRKRFADPLIAARSFLAALKAKDLNQMAQATALRAATQLENQKFFRLILAQKLAQEDLDELAAKLDGFEVAGTHVHDNMNTIGIVVTKSDGHGVLRRTLTVRHEKTGWKLLNISGEGELAAPIIVPRTGGEPR